MHVQNKTEEYEILPSGGGGGWVDGKDRDVRLCGGGLGSGEWKGLRRSGSRGVSQRDERARRGEGIGGGV